MFSKILQICFVISSLSPVLLILWFKEFSKKFYCLDGIFYLIGAVILLILLQLILYIAEKKMEIWSGAFLKITEISNIDNQNLSLMLVYLTPLLPVDTYILWFVIFLLFIVIYRTNLYYFNPMLGILGYYQYKVKLKEGLTMILITKKILVNTQQIEQIVQLTDYMILEKTVNK